jgi:penicillin-binding protein 1A
VLRASLKALGVFLVCAVAVPVGTAATVLGAFLFLPLPAALPTPRSALPSQPSRVLDIDGNEIGIFRRFETSVPFRKEDVPLVLKQAVVAAEDRNFYRHGGVDLRGTARAFWADYRNRGIVQGGSTITQQYVKLAYVGRKRSVWRKVREAVLASQLDRQVDKEEILYRYLSSIYLGNGAYGVEAASELYFRKPVKDVTLSEAAMLAGLIPAPSRYEPLGNPKLAEEKRRLVLKKMYEQGYITAQQYAEAHSQGLWYAEAGPPPGPATLVYRPLQQRRDYPYFLDYVERYLRDRYGERLYTGGLTIQTTLDQRLQKAAEDVVAKALAGTQPPLEMALVAVEPPTGYVKALVGGRDFYASNVNLALGGCPARPTDPRIRVEVAAACWESPTVGGGGLGKQPGSAFKPFTLATALSQGVSPEKVFPAPRSYLPKACKGKVSAGCKPIGNAEGEGGGATTLRRATWHSINTVFAQLIEQVGVKETVEMAKRLGITSEWFSPQVHGLSVTLGAEDVSPLDMASAYGVFATGGKRAEPTPVVRILDDRGRIIEDHTKPVAKQVIDAAVADNVTDILKGVLTSGTGTRARLDRPAAGKTGTGQNYTNAWFVGYTPTLSTAVWMGHRDDQKTPLVNVKGVRRVYGGTIPAATWHDFMVKALEGVPVTDFNEPAPIRPVVEDLKRRSRGGIDPGPRRSPTPVPADCDGPCEVAPPRPVVLPPPTTTTTTTAPFVFGGGAGGGDQPATQEEGGHEAGVSPTGSAAPARRRGPPERRT